MKRKPIFVTILILMAVGLCRAQNSAQADQPLLIQKPTLSRDYIAFMYAGDIWVTGRSGGEARRLTTGTGLETDPNFSPDGSLIAFTGEYEGNLDVYIVPVSGGVPRRLTYHPGPDLTVGWAPDGKRILFSSIRRSYSNAPRLFTVPADGGPATELPLPIGSYGSFSPDGANIAYVPVVPADQIWKRYRGGRTAPIWIAKLADSSIERIPRDNSNDKYPMWMGNKIYFLSDRNGRTSLFAYDTDSRQVAQLIDNHGFDIKYASAGPDAIIYSQLNTVHIYDPKSGRDNKIDIHLSGDIAMLRPRYQNVANNINSISISPNGVRLAVEAHGEILTVPAEKGDIRNLSNTPGVAEHDPAWSPDGKWIAYFSDESGEYALHLREQSGRRETRKLDLGQPPSFFYSPVWSPDSKKIAYTDKRLNIWYIDLDNGKPVKVDTNIYETPFRNLLTPRWSPDSRWITYSRQLRSHVRAIFAYSLESGRSTQITDGLSDARYPIFDKSGKYIYFTASTNFGPTIGWLDMSAINRPVSQNVYVVVLSKDLPSPLAPESDEEVGVEKKDEKINGSKDDKKSDSSVPRVNIDFENISQRMLALPVPARNYTALAGGKAGTIFLVEVIQDGVLQQGSEESLTIHKFDLEKRKVDKLVEGVNRYDFAANGEKLFYLQGGKNYITASSGPVTPGQGLLKTDGLEVYVDPRAEWQQMYREIWRIQRDFFYDPQLHGLNLSSIQKQYAAFLPAVASRYDFNYLLADMLGELTIGHLFIFGGDFPKLNSIKVGLLGADYTIDHGLYRFARVYNGENWNPELRAPLTQPGVNVIAGEYLLAVNGREVKASEDVNSYFQQTAGKSVLIKVGPDPQGANACEVTVVPVESETALRNLAWIEDNRRKVDKMSNGRLAYVYLPNTGIAGYTNFNRYYFSQVDREGAVIDERFNGGGSVADYIIDFLRRPMMSKWVSREGEDFSSPLGSIYGPKAMIVNEFAGSGGDYMPWLFRKAGIGPLVGKRTWGGLVGIYDYPQLIDGGTVTAPRVAFWNPESDWEVENHGVKPDYEVELDPKAWREGHDLQLEKAVQLVLSALDKNPLPKYNKPAYPNYHKDGQ
jgi:tricorn protease